MPLFLIGYWTITTLSVVEVSADGIYRRHWYGREQWMNWSEIASVDHNDFTGTVTLHDFSRNKAVRFNHNRIHFDKFATLLVVLCPHIWRYETHRTFYTHPMKYVYFAMMLTLPLGLVYLVALDSVAIAFIATWILVCGALVILWLAPNRVILHRDHLVVQSPSRTKSYHLAHLRDIVLGSGVKQDQFMTHTVRTALEGAKWTELLFSGFKGGTLTLYCTLHRVLLDYRNYPVRVEWVEQPKKVP